MNMEMQLPPGQHVQRHAKRHESVPSHKCSILAAYLHQSIPSTTREHPEIALQAVQYRARRLEIVDFDSMRLATFTVSPKRQ